MENFNRTKQRGGALAIVLCVLGIIVFLGAIVIGIFVSANNTGVRHDAGLKATHGNNQNILSNYYQKVGEVAQVPGMQAEAQKEIIEAALSGRYGADGSRAVFQSIQEHNPNVSEQMYVKIQTVIEAGRDEFKNNQTLLSDKVRAYEVALNSLPGGMVMRIMGFPRVPLEKYKLITTAAVDTVYEAGKESGPLTIAPVKK